MLLTILLVQPFFSAEATFRFHWLTVLHTNGPRFETSTQRASLRSGFGLPKRIAPRFRLIFGQQFLKNDNTVALYHT